MFKKISNGLYLLKKEVNDMKMLKEITLISESRWQVFESQNGKWELLEEIQNSQLIKVVQKEKFEWIWISAKTYLGDELPFYLNPACVVISPTSLVEYILEPLGRLSSDQDEIAMTIEKRTLEERKEVMIFLKAFYLSPSRENAYAKFEAWQCDSSLRNRFANELIELFGLYKKEIFNFFKSGI